VQPTDPTTPVEPTVPTDPVTPVVPSEPVAPTTPGAVSDDALTESARGPIAAPDSSVAGGTVTVTVGANYTGATVSVWLHSTPVLLATTTVTSAGTVQVTIPTNTAAGAHRIVVVAADGTLVGWDDITVTAASTGSPGALANTGIDTGMASISALLLLLAGATVLVTRRRIRRES